MGKFGNALFARINRTERGAAAIDASGALVAILLLCFMAYKNLGHR